MATTTEQYEVLQANVFHLRKPLCQQLSDCTGRQCRKHGSTDSFNSSDFFDNSLTLVKSLTEPSVDLWHYQSSNNNKLNFTIQNQALSFKESLQHSNSLPKHDKHDFLLKLNSKHRHSFHNVNHANYDCTSQKV